VRFISRIKAADILFFDPGFRSRASPGQAIYILRDLNDAPGLADDRKYEQGWRRGSSGEEFLDLKKAINF
jgi:hypothetical protein